ncbi:MAG: hypothetical protein WAO52_20150 [Prolixibacteraceae bacterium]
MLAESISSFFNSLKQKTTNPFLGTFIIVWLLSNWDLVYSIFTFDAYLSLDRRLEIIRIYIKDHDLFMNLLICIGESIIVLVSTYILINLSRIIINFFEKTITPWVYLITDKGSVILKIDAVKLENEIDYWEQKYNNERSERVRLQTEIEKLEKVNFNLNNSKPDTSEDTSSDIFDENINSLFSQFISKFDIHEIDDLFESLATSEYLDPQDEIIKYSLKMNIIQFITKYDQFQAKYKFTSTGEKIREIYINKSL